MFSKNSLFYFAGVFLLITSFKAGEEPVRVSPEQLNVILSKTPELKAAEITFSKIAAHADKHYQADSSLYFALNQEEKHAASQYIVAHFNVKKDVIGIISHKPFIECDRYFDSYTVQTIPKDGNASNPITINFKDDDYGIFEKDFHFQDDSTLLLTIKTSSEFVKEEDKYDTLFTSVFQLNMAKMPFDTVKVTKSQKVFKK